MSTIFWVDAALAAIICAKVSSPSISTSTLTFGWSLVYLAITAFGSVVQPGAAKVVKVRLTLADDPLPPLEPPQAARAAAESSPPPVPARKPRLVSGRRATESTFGIAPSVQGSCRAGRSRRSTCEQHLIYKALLSYVSRLDQRIGMTAHARLGLGMARPVTITEFADLLRSEHVSAVDAARESIAAIEASQPAINAFIR